MNKIIEFDIFKNHPEVKAAMSTRHGGVSEGIFKSMNLGLRTEDSQDNVTENYRRFAAYIGVDADDFVVSYQEHTTNIKIVSRENTGNVFDWDKIIENTDGLITNERNVVLSKTFADCVPVFLYDPAEHVIAHLHSGWGGTVGKISAKGIEMMHENFGCLPENILAAIGPSICQDCYEVSEELVFGFNDAFCKDRSNGQNTSSGDNSECIKQGETEITDENYKLTGFFKKGRITEDGEQKYHLDLWKAVEVTLLESGILPENICNPRICTCCNHEDLFSHRYTKGRRGNLAGAICLI